MRRSIKIAHFLDGTAEHLNTCGLPGEWWPRFSESRCVHDDSLLLLGPLSTGETAYACGCAWKHCNWGKKECTCPGMVAVDEREVKEAAAVVAWDDLREDPLPWEVGRGPLHTLSTVLSVLAASVLLTGI